MKLLIEKLGISIQHLKCLDEVFLRHNKEYKRINKILHSDPFMEVYTEISRELYSGGKSRGNAKIKFNRQMIMGDIVEYIFSGRAYYFAAKSTKNLYNFVKLVMYTVNQLLIYDSITVNPNIRKLYIEKLEKRISEKNLYEKEGDKSLAQEIKASKMTIGQSDWQKYDAFIDSLLPKTLGTPKELIVFIEFIRLNIGSIIPLLLIQRIFNDKEPIAPPDFLILRGNKDIFGIEVGFHKETQNREFSIRTSIPTFAVDLKNNMHNRCPICGEIILYCDRVIEHYSNNKLKSIMSSRNKTERVFCNDCPSFYEGKCQFSNYFGRVKGKSFCNKDLKDKEQRHYHVHCVIGKHYVNKRNNIDIFDTHKSDFFAQIPEIDAEKSLMIHTQAGNNIRL